MRLFTHPTVASLAPAYATGLFDMAPPWPPAVMRPPRFGDSHLQVWNHPLSEKPERGLLACGFPVPQGDPKEARASF
jgi:hypothetical protein